MFLFFVVSCGGQLKLQEGQEKLVSRDKKPGWLFKIDNDFVVGMSGKFESEKEARADALWDARKKIIERLGMKLSITQQENIYERTSQLDDEIITTSVEGEINTEAISRGLISVKAKEYCVEKYAKKYFGEIEYYYLAYVLVPFSKEEHDNLVNNTFDQLQNRFSNEYETVASVKSDVKSLLIHLNFLEKLIANAKDLIGMKSDLVAIVDGWQASLQKEKSLLKENIHITRIGMEQSIGTDRKLNEVIGVKLFYRDSPISNIGVKFFKGEIKIAEGFTDEIGEYVFLYHSPVIGNLDITARVNLGEEWQFSPVHFFFQNPLKVVLSIPELNAQGEQNNRIVENAVSEYLLQNGIYLDQSISLSQVDVVYLLKGRLDILAEQVKDCGYLLLIGRSYVQKVSKLPLTKNMFQAQSGCELKLIDPVNESIVWNVALTQDYVSGSSLLEAGNNSLLELSNMVIAKIEEFLHE